MAVALTASGFVVAQTPPQKLPAYQVEVPPWLSTGPMIGHVGPDEVQVWLRHGKGVRINARGSLRVGARYRAVPARIEKLDNRIKRIVFAGLPPSTELTVHVYEGVVPTRGAALTVRTAPAAAKTGTVRVAFGANFYAAAFPKCRAFLGAAGAKPDLFLFAGGACCYVRKRGGSETDADPLQALDLRTGNGDWRGAKQMRNRQLEARGNPWLQPLLRTVPAYAVWGRYDFGPADSPQFCGADASLEVFRQMWCNPWRPQGPTKGVFCSFRRGPVEVFLLDSFYHRAAGRDARVLGEAQTRWLLARLKVSTAPVKLLVLGSPATISGVGEPSLRAEAPAEWKQLVEGLRKHSLGSVLLLTGGGDRAGLARLPGSDSALWHEFHAGPLSWGRGPKADRTAGPAAGLLWQSRRDSYGLVEVTTKAAGGGTVTLTLRDRKNRIVEVEGVRCQTRIELPAPKPR